MRTYLDFLFDQGTSSENTGRTQAIYTCWDVLEIKNNEMSVPGLECKLFRYFLSSEKKVGLDNRSIELLRRLKLSFLCTCSSMIKVSEDIDTIKRSRIDIC